MNFASFDPKRRRLRHLLSGLAVTLALGTALVPAHAADPSDISEAERLVFVEHQLANIKAPTSLRYSFVKSGSQEPGFEDEVAIDIRKVAPAGSTVGGSFLSGARNVKLPDIDGAQANPVILYFLEHDIREMARVTKRKNGNYFRNRIRRTLVDEAQIRDTTISFEGRTLPAKEVVLTPYLTDPARSRYEQYAHKRYTFLLSSAVPGGVYRVQTALPGAQPSDAPVLEEVMTLTGPVAGRSAAASNALNQPVKSR